MTYLCIWLYLTIGLGLACDYMIYHHNKSGKFNRDIWIGFFFVWLVMPTVFPAFVALAICKSVGYPIKDDKS